MTAWEGQLEEEDDDFYDEDEWECDFCGESSCLCQEAADCICGAYQFSDKSGKATQYADCVCGRA